MLTMRLLRRTLHSTPENSQFQKGPELELEPSQTTKPRDRLRGRLHWRTTNTIRGNRGSKLNGDAPMRGPVLWDGSIRAGGPLDRRPTYTTTMSKTKNITAKFLKTYALTTATNGGDGTGTVPQTLVSGKCFRRWGLQGRECCDLNRDNQLLNSQFDWMDRCVQQARRKRFRHHG